MYKKKKTEEKGEYTLSEPVPLISADRLSPVDKEVTLVSLSRVNCSSSDSMLLDPDSLSEPSELSLSVKYK